MMNAEAIIIIIIIITTIMGFIIVMCIQATQLTPWLITPFIPLRSPSTTFSDVSGTYPAPATLASFTSLLVCPVY